MTDRKVEKQRAADDLALLKAGIERNTDAVAAVADLLADCQRRAVVEGCADSTALIETCCAAIDSARVTHEILSTAVPGVERRIYQNRSKVGRWLNRKPAGVTT